MTTSSTSAPTAPATSAERSTAGQNGMPWPRKLTWAYTPTAINPACARLMTCSRPKIRKSPTTTRASEPTPNSTSRARLTGAPSWSEQGALSARRVRRDREDPRELPDDRVLRAVVGDEERREAHVVLALEGEVPARAAVERVRQRSD